jgi:hypothetical protein
MGAFTSALALAGVGLQAYGQYKSGQDAYAAAQYNAAIFQQQSEVLDVKKGITREQYDRMIRKLEGASVTAIAASGYDFSGSFLEFMNDTLTQAQLDKQLELYNLEVEKRQAISAADESRRSGTTARTSANIQSVATLLTEGNEWYSKYGGFGSTKKPAKKT